MKKKESINKPTKSKSVETTTKKTTTKIKSKSKDAKKQQPSFFVLLGDSFYVASSKTERKSYQQFEHKVKVAQSSLKKAKHRGQSNFQESVNLQEYVKTLSKEEKQRLLRDLSKEIEPDKHSQPSVVEEKEDKMLRLTEKLESIKNQLIFRWDEQINKINHSFENQQIGLEEKNEKIMLIQKIKSNKIGMINYTKVLFDKILREESDIELEKSERVENFINSLNSIESMDPRDPVNHLQIDPRQLISTFGINSVEQHFRPALKFQEIEKEKEELQFQKDLSHDQPEPSFNIKIEDFEKSDSLIMSKDHLKLDIRLDEVEFGKDHYEDEVIFSKEENHQLKIDPIKHEVLKLEFVGEKKSFGEETKLTFGLPRIEEGEHLSDGEFLCVGEENHQIQIPLLMTRDRLEQIEIQKTAKEVEALTISLKAKQALQLSEIVPQTEEHFTTLIDVNQFIVQFYEFVIKKYMREVIEGMNVPYGKSCADKLYMIRKEGFVPDYDHNNVLSQEFLNNFHREMTLSVRKIKDYEKAHNLALFHAFNHGLNVYRPYYELEGEVFPWSTSEKGLTFYEISDENIEEVFEKSKMKILEYCASLCGLMPECEVTTVQAKKLLSKRNEDGFERVLKAEMIEKYGEWNIKRVNFQALSRINICEEIFACQIALLCEDLSALSRR